MPFEDEIRSYLPAGLPHRERVVVLCARHLELIEEANRVMNLTRIVDAKEAAIKHVVDCLQPWRLFIDAGQVIDAGTGAGFPGVPLSIVLPEVTFTLCESTQKKARFVAAALETLKVTNASVQPVRAEDWLKANRAEVIVARALAPVQRAVELFAGAIKGGARVLLYKGPDVEQEMAAASETAKMKRIAMKIVERYELPRQFGARTILELSRAPAK